MLCSRCQKNVAVVFINKFEDGKQINEGLCLSCAKELGIKPLEQMMNQMGITEADLDELNTEMGEFLSDMNVSDNMTMPQSFAGERFKGKAASEEKQEKEEKSNKKSMLETYGTNLTQKARDNELDAVVGREKEIERVIHILNRRTKNNPVLLGEPGVGKTAVAEAIALRIVEEKVPYKLLDYEVYLLDFTALLAGTQFRGQFEARLKSLLNEVKERKNIILVIDELHNIVAAGDAEGAMNAANILKPALARGEIRVIGATTLTEYRKHIEKDSALERRFAPVILEEPSSEEAIEILKGLRPFYENFHRVKLSDEVLEAAVRLSKRYIPERYLPDKAIDLIDECGSEKNLNNHALSEIQKLNKQLKSIVEEKDSLMGTENEETYQKLADLKIEECRISDRLKELEQEASDACITMEDIARVIERWSSIPVTDLTQSDAKRLLNLSDRIKKRLVGQDEAVEAVAKVIRRSRAGLTKKKKPASFLFVGPTGVGKTELVKTLARELFGSEEAIIRFDMSEYMERHSVSKLIGSPPGYVGYDDAGMLTEKVRRHPYSIILLDEIEKAHNDIFNLLLQVLDDGVLTDSHGKTVHFENTVIIMTSNAGSDYRAASYGFVENESKAVSDKSDTALKELFRPEFLNRIDEIVHFHQLNRENMKSIVDIMIGDLTEELSGKHITLTLTEAAKDYLADKGYDKRFGARPLRRLIQKEIESELADLYISGKIREHQSVSIDAEEDHLSFRIE